MKNGRQFSLSSFVLPGFNHILSKRYGMGLFFLSLAIFTCLTAYAVNTKFFLAYIWKLKELSVPHTMVSEFRNCKKESLYSFLYAYLVIGSGAFLDLALLPKKHGGSGNTKETLEGTSESQ